MDVEQVILSVGRFIPEAEGPKLCKWRKELNSSMYPSLSGSGFEGGGTLLECDPSSHCCDFPIMMDCTLKCDLKWILSLLSCFSFTGKTWGNHKIEAQSSFFDTLLPPWNSRLPAPCKGFFLLPAGAPPLRVNLPLSTFVLFWVRLFFFCLSTWTSVSHSVFHLTSSFGTI